MQGAQDLGAKPQAAIGHPPLTGGISATSDSSFNLVSSFAYSAPTAHMAWGTIRARGGATTTIAPRNSRIVAADGNSTVSSSLPASSLATANNFYADFHDTTNGLPPDRTSSAIFGHQAVGQSEQLDGVDGWFRGALLHLHIARAALGGSDLKRAVADRGNQVPGRPASSRGSFLA